MKKLLSLLFALLLLASPALAQGFASGDALTETVYQALCTALEEAGLSYETEAEIHGCYLAFDAAEATILGDEIYVDIYAYPDGVCITAYTPESVPENRAEEVIRLCNLFNMATICKYYLSTADNTLCFEVFLHLDAENIRDYDLWLMGDYASSTAGTLDYDTYYFVQVIEHSESAENALAMWEADWE